MQENPSCSDQTLWSGSLKEIAKVQQTVAEQVWPIPLGARTYIVLSDATSVLQGPGLGLPCPESYLWELARSILPAI